MKRWLVNFCMIALGGIVFVSSAWAGSLSIVEPKDNAVVASPFAVRFQVQGMKVEPAGTVVQGAGHHHLLVNMEPIPKGEEIPFTKRHLHFGQGQTDARVNLPPGVYKLTAQFADGEHKSYGSEYSHAITLTVK